ncbi:hypothetical protein QBC44DRAFT_364028 [Cladorrhinum sp. PSN332]|nr:hypothetical protein QBC44DRAFT_364028 [Cladorrhinum sp. PSN332]
MDPFSALSVAAGVIQFADFGARLLTRSVQIYHSEDGLTREEDELDSVSRNLRELAQNIQSTSTDLIRSQRSLRPAEQTLIRLSKECERIATEISSGLEHTFSSDTLFNSWLL